MIRRTSWPKDSAAHGLRNLQNNTSSCSGKRLWKNDGSEKTYSRVGLFACIFLFKLLTGQNDEKNKSYRLNIPFSLPDFYLTNLLPKPRRSRPETSA